MGPNLAEPVAVLEDGASAGGGKWRRRGKGGGKGSRNGYVIAICIRSGVNEWRWSTRRFGR